jgi:WD40 repeat protein
MMWSRPTVDNNFTVAAKCRVGHKNDVLALDCSSNFIVSGGVDGIVSVWNAFSGQLKYAI